MHLAWKTRAATLGIGFSLVLGACGSTTDAPPADAATPDQGSAPAASQAPPAESSPAGSEASPAASSPAGESDIGPLNTAVVVIGDERYEFTDVKCSIFTARYIQAGNFGGDPEVSIVLPPEGWESQGDTFGPPSVRVTIGDGLTGQMWVAGDNGSPVITPLKDGASSIDSYTVPDGRPVKATGTATFIDLAAHNNGKDAPSVAGTFEVTCP